MSVWGRRKKEPNLWFDRFETYRLMGPARTLLGCINLDRAKVGKARINYISGAWTRNSRQWKWIERAEEWDESEREKAREELEAERDEWRKRRRQLLRAFYGQVGAAMREYSPEAEVSLGTLTHAVRTVVQELRSEYDELPTVRTEVVLPAELEEAMPDFSDMSDEQLLELFVRASAGQESEE